MEMKKIFIAIGFLLCLNGCAKTDTPENENQVVINSKVTLESTTPDLSDYRWVNVDQAGVIEEINAYEAIRLFEEKGSAILYYGRANCPFCQRALPELYFTAKELGVIAYYVNVEGPEFTMDAYEATLPYIDSVLVEEGEEKAFYIPEVIGVKDGTIVGHHTALVSGYSIAGEDSQMDDKQKEELRSIYEEIIRAVAQ